MFGSAEKNRGDKGLAHTLVSRKTEIVGDIHFVGELIIEGKIKGSIYADDESEALVRVSEQGVIEGDICVPSVVINGLVNGDIHSNMHVELAAKAVVVGNVYYNMIEMVMGAEVNGSLMHLAKNHIDAKKLSMGKKVISHDSLLGNTAQSDGSPIAE